MARNGRRRDVGEPGRGRGGRSAPCRGHGHVHTGAGRACRASDHDAAGRVADDGGGLGAEAPQQRQSGEIARPHTREDIEGKFRQLARPLWGEAVAERLWQGCRTLEAIPDFARFSEGFDL